ncbi:MAG: hypothetical protein Q9197_005952, partial [Variospora fuerteventurae]
HGRPPLPTEALFSSANFTLSLLPIRLAHRIQALRNLPFIVVSNPHIAQIYNNYVHSLSTLLPYQERRITNLEDEIRFTEVMADLVQTHSNTIPILARGFLECRKYISPAQVTRFLDEHLRARIGTRLIAEQHIALHLSSQPHNGGAVTPQEHDDSSYIGVIDTALRPAEIIRNCEGFVGEICELKYGVRPAVIINGQPDTTVTHVPTHLEYIITELLKNAFRATVECGKEKEPIEATIAAAPNNADVATNASEGERQSPFIPSTPGVTIRIRDRGGGISPEVLPSIWAYSFTTFADEVLSGVGNTGGNGNGNTDALNAISGAGGDSSSLAGLGYGLPLGRAYAEHFGGGVQVQNHFFRDFVRGEYIYTLFESKSGRVSEAQPVLVPEPAVRRSDRAREETSRHNSLQLERTRAREERRQRGSSNTSGISLQTLRSLGRRASFATRRARPQQSAAPQPHHLTLEQQVRRNQERGRGVERAASGYLSSREPSPASHSPLAPISEHEQQPRAVQKAKSFADLITAPSTITTTTNTTTATDSITAVGFSSSPSSSSPPSSLRVPARAPLRGTKSADCVGSAGKDSGLGGSPERPDLEVGDAKGAEEKVVGKKGTVAVAV